MSFGPPENSLKSLSVREVLTLIRGHWGVSYDLRLVIRGNGIYLHIMWAYLEQKSFGLTEEEYLQSLAYVIDVVNRLGQASVVRNWLLNCSSKPRLGKAISLKLKGEKEVLKEFVL
ncbi:DUF3067 family protein [Prochlorococcus marinus]|uniref:DUF3067 family protein n=1 Tax=Prochlorococcus marinus TaxID=1219 RepID=UPI000326543D|nr:DUF3067 family protein [Prochlorococcus marinus]